MATQADILNYVIQPLSTRFVILSRMEAELGDERTMFVDGSERDWRQQPRPPERLYVGLDGGYVHALDGDNCKAGWWETLQTQGLQMNQPVTFMSDGAENLRELQQYLSPEAEHILDWFHVTMRLTVMRQMMKSLPLEAVYCRDLPQTMESLKWHVWHGNVAKALYIIEDLPIEFESCDDTLIDERFDKLGQLIDEFGDYIMNKRDYIPNYGDRYYYGEPITTAFVESAVNEVVSRPLVKKQQMRWTKEGAHLLLQVRTKNLNDELRDKFVEWYPGMSQSSGSGGSTTFGQNLTC